MTLKSPQPSMATSVLLKRSLLVIWIPPIFSLLLTARVFLLMATFANRETAWVLALGASFGVSLVPALVWWASMESIWMWRGPRIRTHCAAIVVSGGLLGAVLAFLVSLLLEVSRFRFQGGGRVFCYWLLLRGPPWTAHFPAVSSFPAARRGFAVDPPAKTQSTSECDGRYGGYNRLWSGFAGGICNRPLVCRPFTE